LADKKYHKVTFLPENKTIQVEDRKSIFETILEDNPENIELKFSCGAEGICQKCKIRAFQQMGPITPTEKGCLSDEEFERGVRLACQARIIQDTSAEIIYKMPFSIDLVDEILTEDMPLNPRVYKVFYPEVKSEDLPDRIIADLIKSGGDGAGKQVFADDIRRRFTPFLESDVLSCTAVFIGDELLYLEEGDTRDKLYAVAVDLGTNTIAASLINLGSGKKMAVVTDTNPQIILGADLKTRIDMILEDQMNLEILNEEILLRIDILITELCRACDIDPHNVYEIVVAGSTGMLHILVSGVPGLMEKNEGTLFFEAEQLEIRSSSRARVYPFPVISSYAGADIVSGILATKIHRSEQTVLFIDMGSDTKLILCHQGKIMATAVYDTDIFECVSMDFGMRPETGAIDRVKTEGDLILSVIGESLPRGICGSGFMELAVFLKKEGIIDGRGNFYGGSGKKPELLKRVVDKNGSKAFLLYSDEGSFKTDIFITEKDLKTLFSAALKVLDTIFSFEKYTGIHIEEIPEILIGGAFGHNIDTVTFKGIGLLPLSFENKVSFVGNSSKKGAQMALLDKNILPEAEALVHTIELLSP